MRCQGQGFRTKLSPMLFPNFHVSQWGLPRSYGRRTQRLIVISLLLPYGSQANLTAPSYVLPVADRTWTIVSPADPLPGSCSHLYYFWSLPNARRGSLLWLESALVQRWLARRFLGILVVKESHAKSQSARPSR